MVPPDSCKNSRDYICCRALAYYAILPFGLSEAFDKL